MELELGRLVLGRMVRNPWLAVAVLLIGLLPPMIRLLGPLGISPQHLHYQALTTASLFLWGLVGGVAGLGTLRSIEPWLERLSRGRQWRARLDVLLWTLVGPLPCVLLPSLWLGGFASVPASILPWVALLAYFLAAACVVDALRMSAFRSIAYLSLAWWLPALVPSLFRGVLGGAWHSSPGSHDPVFSTSVPGSTAPLGEFAPILALGLLAWGIDLLRRRTA